MEILIGFLICLVFVLFITIGYVARRVEKLEQASEQYEFVEDVDLNDSGSLVFENEEAFEQWLTAMISKIVSDEITKQ